MSGRYDVLVLGSGPDELVAACRLASAGYRVVALEPGGSVGGGAASVELEPGFRVDPVWADAGFVDPRILRDLELERYGLALLAPDPALCAPAGEGPPLVLWRDVDRTVAALAGRSPKDADRWPDFADRMEGYARVLEEAAARPVLSPAAPVRDLVAYLGLGRRVRALGRERMVEFLRVLPLPARDLLDDEFGDETLKGALGAIAVRGIFQGPRSPGTSLVFLQHHVGCPRGAFGLRTVPRGGLGGLIGALDEAARARGVELRTDARASAILVEEGRASGVELDGGEVVPARAVLSGADPVRTLLSLVGAPRLDPDGVQALRNIRFRGGFARVHLALSEAPRFEGLEEVSAGVIVVAPGLDGIERAYDDAKHGGVSTTPVLEARVPSFADPTLAPPGRHVMSVDVRFLPVGERAGSLDDHGRETLGDRVVGLLGERAPNLPGAILARRILLPQDLEERYGWTGGDPWHGELALDQLLFMRPVPGWARSRTPVPGLWLCGPGTHPAGAVTGNSGGHAAAAIDAELGGGS